MGSSQSCNWQCITKDDYDCHWKCCEITSYYANACKGAGYDEDLMLENVMPGSLNSSVYQFEPIVRGGLKLAIKHPYKIFAFLAQAYWEFILSIFDKRRLFTHIERYSITTNLKESFSIIGHIYEDPKYIVCRMAYGIPFVLYPQLILQLINFLTTNLTVFKIFKKGFSFLFNNKTSLKEQILERSQGGNVTGLIGEGLEKIVLFFADKFGVNANGDVVGKDVWKSNEYIPQGFQDVISKVDKIIPKFVLIIQDLLDGKISTHMLDSLGNFNNMVLNHLKNDLRMCSNVKTGIETEVSLDGLDFDTLLSLFRNETQGLTSLGDLSENPIVRKFIEEERSMDEGNTVDVDVTE